MQKKHNMYTGLVGVVFGVIVIILSLNLPADFITGKRQHMFLPLGAATAMVISGIALFIKNYKKIKEEGLPEEAAKSGSEKHMKLIVATIILSVIYAFIFQKLGYVISTTLYLCSIMFILRGIKKWLTNILIPLAFSYIIVVTFGNFLQIYLPTL